MELIWIIGTAAGLLGGLGCALWSDLHSDYFWKMVLRRLAFGFYLLLVVSAYSLLEEYKWI